MKRLKAVCRCSSDPHRHTRDDECMSFPIARDGGGWWRHCRADGCLQLCLVPLASLLSLFPFPLCRSFPRPLSPFPSPSPSLFPPRASASIFVAERSKSPLPHVSATPFAIKRVSSRPSRRASRERQSATDGLGTDRRRFVRCPQAADTENLKMLGKKVPGTHGHLDEVRRGSCRQSAERGDGQSARPRLGSAPRRVEFSSCRTPPAALSHSSDSPRLALSLS